MGTGVATDAVGREPATAVAVLGRRIDRRTQVELVAADVDQRQVDGRPRDVRCHVDG
jgi:hypothetical protein